MDPELIEALINEVLFAQQDVTRVDTRRQAPETGSIVDFLQALGELGLDFTPGVGDVKAAAFDAPRQFGEGENLAGLLSLLSAIPGIGILGDLVRAGGKGAKRAGRGTEGLGGVREQIFRDLVPPDPFGDAGEAHQRLVKQLDELARRRGGN